MKCNLCFILTCFIWIFAFMNCILQDLIRSFSNLLSLGNCVHFSHTIMCISSLLARQFQSIGQWYLILSWSFGFCLKVRLTMAWGWEATLEMLVSQIVLPWVLVRQTYVDCRMRQICLWVTLEVCYYYVWDCVVACLVFGGVWLVVRLQTTYFGLHSLSC